MKLDSVMLECRNAEMSKAITLSTLQHFSISALRPVRAVLKHGRYHYRW